MLKTIKRLKEIEKQFATDNQGNFIDMKFKSGNEIVCLTGKSMDDLTAIEIVKLKKFSASFINEAMQDLINI